MLPAAPQAMFALADSIRVTAPASGANAVDRHRQDAVALLLGAERAAGDAHDEPDDVVDARVLARFAGLLSAGEQPQDRLPESDTAAPRIGANGPAHASMTLCQDADLRVCVELRGFEPPTPSMRTERTSVRLCWQEASANVSGRSSIRLT